MNCCIYRSKKKPGSYLYINEKNNFSDIPKELFRLFGVPEFSFEFDLTEDKTLAQSDPKEVLLNLKKNGFFLQLPPPDEFIRMTKA